jgi:hypothetical protein
VNSARPGERTGHHRGVGTRDRGGARSRQLRRLVRDSPIFDGVRPQRVRGPLDWYYNLRIYAVVGLLVLAVPWVGLLFLFRGPWWERLAGLVLFPAGSVLAFGAVQWLRRPVDPYAAAALEARYRQSRFLRWWRSPDKPPPGFLTVDLRPPWVRPTPKLADAFADEASREITSGHPLFSKDLICRARCEICDLLVFESHDGTWAIVRLTGRLRQRPPLPETIRFDSYAALERAMEQHQH